MKTLTLTAFSFLILLSPAAAQSGAPARMQDRASNTAAHTPAADVSADYRLGVGDKLRVEVYKDPQLSQSLQVRPDGKVTLPLIGDIPAAGRTSTELRDAITTSLKDYITTPTVTVIVVETVPPTVYVMGEVNAAGPQPLRGPTSVLQALAMAGGFKDFAHTKDIKILRKTPTGLKTLKFNYNEAVKSTNAPLLLEPGDTIIVP
jgi:polysaccharide export outer membrane protein